MQYIWGHILHGMYLTCQLTNLIFIILVLVERNQLN